MRLSKLHASFALDAMARAIEELKAGKSSARDWFARERGNFMQAIYEGLGTRIGRQARSAPAVRLPS
jgi:RecB family exonuclease